MSSFLSFVEQLAARCLNIDVLVSLLALVFVYFFLIRSDALYEFVGKILVKLELKVTGHYDHVPVDGESVVSAHKTRASWEYKKDNVGVYAIQGRRPHMEDRFNVVSELEHTGTSIYGVFDGHGGEFAADYTEKTLFKIIMVRLLKAALAGERLDLSALLTEEILNVDKQLLVIERSTGEISGTTALVALLRDNQLYVANVGDSRAVMCDHAGNTLPLSFDHKPQQVKERRRIKKAGGFISFNGVWRVAGILATSRALGDYPLKEHNFVIADPDVLTFDLDEIRPRFMIIASDGLWDAFSNEEAVNYIKDRLDEPHFGAKSIVLQAYYRGSLDNVTVMIVNFLLGTVVETSTEELMTNADEVLVGGREDEVDEEHPGGGDSTAPVMDASSSATCDNFTPTSSEASSTSKDSKVSFSLCDVEPSTPSPESVTTSPMTTTTPSDENVSSSHEDALSIAHERRVLAFRKEQVLPLQEDNLERAQEEIVAPVRDGKEALPTCVETVFQVAPSCENNESSLQEEVVSPIFAEDVSILQDITQDMQAIGEDELSNSPENCISAVVEESVSPSQEEAVLGVREMSSSLETCAAELREESISPALENSASTLRENSKSPTQEEIALAARQTNSSSNLEEVLTTSSREDVSPTRDGSFSPFNDDIVPSLFDENMPLDETHRPAQYATQEEIIANETSISSTSHDNDDADEKKLTSAHE